MSFWDSCEGEKYIEQIEIDPWRVVEAQYNSSSRDLVDSIEEHDLLEELLEKSKPNVANKTHYLIFTPFRYPPLKYGSRFGRQYEPSLWYGSLELQTALAEVAFYRLKFFDDSSANLGYIEIPMTAFKAHIKTKQGVDLTKNIFSKYIEKISHKNNYDYSQSLGTDMRNAGIEVFLFASARVSQLSKNAAAFIPTVFIKKNGQFISNMQNWSCLANKNIIEFSRFGILNTERLSFSKEDFEMS
ncbi:RES family NAD+ phosphorylase [Legionella jamestowniensis]|uniref:RES domain protein n=1 Tax=Legionella jamestowniensis TaxID=455 RepID=A0A0W0UGU3_9GAMM|nr:RES family NAD+ phosphorylase [Legionella jamestowniensis]KTD07059.1 RES domain protein [Legionella jamestowniensis]SFM03101.1 RES domain-containing protein [Legionella jamestowniensis DSM 19215]